MDTQKEGAARSKAAPPAAMGRAVGTELRESSLTAEPKAIAQDYITRGWSPLPLKRRDKRPRDKGWPDHHYSADDFPDGANIGVKLGGPSGGLVDFDLDWLEARGLADRLLDALPRFGRASARGGHRLAICPDIARVEAYKLPADMNGDALLPGEHGLCVLELRGNGQTMFPGSMHPSGETVEWQDPSAVPVPELSADDARRRAGLLAFLSVVARYYPAKGSRDDTCMALAGALLAAEIERDVADQMVRGVAEYCGDEEAGDRGKAARTSTRLETGEPATGLPRLVQLLGLPESVAATFRGWLGISDKLVLKAGAPLKIADAFLERHYTADGHLLLRGHQQELLAYDGAAYRALEDQTVRQQLYEFLEGAFKHGKEEPVPFEPSESQVGGIMSALRARCHVPADTLSPPCWLGEYPTKPAEEIVACQNGLLHLPTGELLAPTPEFFTRNALEFAYDAAAPDPEQWLAFLDQLWPDDPEQVELLQEIFGYLLTPDTSQQKIFLVVGPKRAGKGTIGRLVEQLVGARNLAAPTLGSLSGDFGLQPLIGKQVALISDAQLDPRTATSSVGENLKRISGEDTVTANRKQIDMWTGRLAVRFLLLANELPRLSDNSGALASRFVVLRLTRSFYGEEDHELDAKLAAELPGILNWAIAGWRRLNERGRFALPDSSAEATAELANLGSPTQAFLQDRCELGVDKTVSADMLFEAWRDWCHEEGRDFPGNRREFGRKLAAAAPRVDRKYVRCGEKRRYIYQGVALVADSFPI